MTARLFKYTKPLAGIAALSLLAACTSDLTGGNRHPVQLSFATKTGVATSAGLSADVVAAATPDITPTRVQLVFRKIELDRQGTADCSAESDDVGDDKMTDDSHHHDGRVEDECEDVLANPLLVDIPVDDALHAAINVPLPEGRFSEIEAKLGPARDASILDGNSVRVTGTFGPDKKPFTFESKMRAKLEMSFDPAFVVDAITKNTTVNIDVSKWFLSSSGAVLDPTDAANRVRIENNIRRSFHAFEDNHERGEDRHEGHR
jgi:hypothetical protein